MTKIKYLAIDYGGVLAYHYCEPYQTELADLLGVSVEVCKNLISEKSPQGRAYRMKELDTVQFWDIVLSLAGRNKNNIDIDYLQELWSRTYQPNWEMIDFVFGIKQNIDVKIVLATNSDFTRNQFIKNHFAFYNKFDLVLASWQYKVVKPSKDFFVKLIELTVKTEPSNNILFVDDRINTTNAAKEYGMDIYTYSNLILAFR
jgi:FMN phosphatase YigB (HAD superfamily)